jgi:hypothetical protein
MRNCTGTQLAASRQKDIQHNNQKLCQFTRQLAQHKCGNALADCTGTPFAASPQEDLQHNKQKLHRFTREVAQHRLWHAHNARAGAATWVLVLLTTLQAAADGQLLLREATCLLHIPQAGTIPNPMMSS